MFFQSKTIKKLVATALTASFVATAVVPTASAASVKDFKDVQGHYTSAVDYLVDHNISIGISEDVLELMHLLNVSMLLFGSLEH